MNAAPKVLLSIGALAVLLGIGYTLWGGGASLPVSPANRSTEPAPQTGAEERPATAQGGEVNAETSTDPSRQELRNAELVGSGDTFPQGVTGRIVDPSMRPVAGAEVALVVSPHSDIFTAIRKSQAGIKDPPVAMTETNEAGLFSAGIAAAEDNVYDLWVFHPDWADHQHKGIRIQADDWYDTKDIVLEPGATVFGRVTDERTGAPIAEATVVVSRSDQFTSFTTVPGREAGLSVLTDASGSYRFPNAAPGAVTLMVDDPRYAKAVHTNVMLKRGEEVQYDFDLGLGYTIRGAVVDERGEPVGGAKVQAVSLSAKQPQSEEASTGRDGRFEIPGLRDGAFQLSITAKDFQPAKESPVLSAEGSDVEIVLEDKNSISVRVVADNGRAIKQYRLRVLRHFPANSSMGAIPEIPPRVVRPADIKDGVARVDGVNFGHYALEVIADGFAKSFSEPFEILPGMEDPVVEVTLEVGATLLGRVVDGEGKGVGGAVISTEADGQMDLGSDGLQQIFGSLVKNAPKRISTVDVKSAANGSFRITNLPYGEYQLRVAHPDYVGKVQTSVILNDPGEYEVPQMVLEKGCLITGFAAVDGVRIGQLKVRLSTPAPEQVPGQPPAPMTSEEIAQRVSTSAVTLNDGSFRMLKRVPPGTYDMQAERMTAGPFEKMLDHRNSKRTVVVRPGQETMEVSLNITSN